MDRRTDAEGYNIIRPFFKRAYKKCFWARNSMSKQTFGLHCFSCSLCFGVIFTKLFPLILHDAVMGRTDTIFSMNSCLSNDRLSYLPVDSYSLFAFREEH